VKTRKLGRTGLQVSEIGFGALEIGRAWGLPIEGDFAVPSEQEVHALLDRVLELGINLIDTAPAYMLSEERIGKLLKHRRKEFYLASKCGEHFDGYDSRYDFSQAGTLRFIVASLERLQTDYLDLVQIHCGPDEEETIQRGETLEGMLRAKQQGKVRWVGVSCHAGGARVALDKGGYDVLQLP
jgi:aryl-alcohol dehydrogenase-like predicted oxidoreductase